MRIWLVAVCLTATLASISACGTVEDQGYTPAPAASDSSSTAEPISDLISWPVTIEADQLPPVQFETPSIAGDRRILALAVGSADVVDLLGAGDQLIGQDETSVSRGDVPVVTLGHQIDVEQALSLDPTVVLVDDLVGPPEAIDALERSGTEIVSIPSVWSLSDVRERVAAIADAVGVGEETASRLGAALTERGVTTEGAPPRVAFLYLRGPSAIYLLGGADTGADALIEAAGGIDVGVELGYEGFVPLTAEAMIEADPDVVLVMTEGLESVGGVDGLLELPGVAQTRAGSKGYVVAVDDRVLLSFGARTPALLTALGDVLGDVELR